MPSGSPFPLPSYCSLLHILTPLTLASKHPFKYARFLSEDLHPTVSSTWVTLVRPTQTFTSFRFSARVTLPVRSPLTVLFTFAIPVSYTACLPYSRLTVGSGGPEIPLTPDLSLSTLGERRVKKANKGCQTILKIECIGNY